MKKLSYLFTALAIVLSDIMCFVVAYNYRDMLCSIEHAGYSAPASTAFLYAIPAYAIVQLSLRSAWKDFRWNKTLISILMWGGLLSLYASLKLFVHVDIWKLFLLGIPGQLAIFYWFRLFRKPSKEEHNG